MREHKVTFDTILMQTRQYYDKTFDVYGMSPKGVDWNSAQSQELRFEQLLKVCNTKNFFSLNDYGCGYGALAAYMKKKKYTFQYNGYDLSAKMIEKAQKEYSNVERCKFFSDKECLCAADYTVASGIFNVKLQTDIDNWQGYVLDTIRKIAKLSKKGFAFNVLTTYSDPEFMRDELFYADPLFLFDNCKRNLSRFVAVLHDYPLYEFTIIVKKETS